MKIHTIFLLLILGCGFNVMEAHSGNEIRNRKRSTQEDTRRTMANFAQVSQGNAEVVESFCDLNCMVKGAGYCCAFSSIGGIIIFTIEAMDTYLKNKF